MIPSSLAVHYAELQGAQVAPFGSGLINKTYLATTDAGKWVVQRLHPVFGGIVNEDIDVVTTHLAAQGIVTPRLVRTHSGATYVEEPDHEGNAQVWRVITHVDGVAFQQIASPAHAHEAGALVGRFHNALENLSYEYQHVRAGVHDLRRHLVKLATSLPLHAKHRLAGEVAPLAQAILEAGALLPDLSALPKQHAHGDLKVSNLLFSASGHGLCLVDLDTLQMQSLAYELGDAMRSWCNAAGEDVANASVDVDVFRAALEGYCRARVHHTRSGPLPLQRSDVVSVVDGLRVICVELAARFLTDALREEYFGYDATRFPARGEHNLLRARGQWSLAMSVKKQRDALMHIVNEVALS
jgi:Ser/Thr protein kinase RdoA (MazF antagonist)